MVTQPFVTDIVTAYQWLLQAPGEPIKAQLWYPQVNRTAIHLQTAST